MDEPVGLAVEHDEITNRNPARQSYALKAPKKIPRSLTVPQQTRLFAALACDHTPAGLRDYALLATLGYAGLRTSEVAALTLDTVDLESGTLFIREGKGGKDRTTPILPPLDGILARYVEHSRPHLLRSPDERAFFVSTGLQRGRGCTLGSRGVWYIVRRVIQRVLGISAHPHMLRHALGFRLHEHGASPLDIRDMLGHESVRTTERYIGTTSGGQRERLARFIEGQPSVTQPQPAPPPAPETPRPPKRPHTLADIKARVRKPRGGGGFKGRELRWARGDLSAISPSFHTQLSSKSFDLL